LKSSSNRRQARRLLGVSASGVDIVFPFGKMSTHSDQTDDKLQYWSRLVANWSGSLSTRSQKAATTSS
jgi:hypothetical protein